MVILEAMSCALPTIASDVGAIPGMLADDSGILVPPGDDRALRAGHNGSRIGSTGQRENGYKCTKGC